MSWPYSVTAIRDAGAPGRVTINRDRAITQRNRYNHYFQIQQAEYSCIFYRKNSKRPVGTTDRTNETRVVRATATTCRGPTGVAAIRNAGAPLFIYLLFLLLCHRMIHMIKVTIAT